MPFVLHLLFIAFLIFHGQKNINTFSYIDDINQALEIAKAKNKPIFLLFTGKQCENNKDIQEKIINNPALAKKMKTEFIPTFLFVDDNTPLFQPYHFKWEGKSYIIKTIGQKWWQLEIEQFGCHATPLICVLDPKGQKITRPIQYPNISENLESYLKSALNVYEKR